MSTYSLREAAELSGLSLKAIRHRADRGTLTTVLAEGQRRVPHFELERAGLLPGSELQELRAKLDRLTAELASSRQLVESTERAQLAEQQARERTEAAFQEQRAAAIVAQEQAVAATSALEELQALEEQLRDAGPLRAWKLARTRRRSQQVV